MSSNSNSVASKFKYNGIELEESLGLNLYEMEFRQYDPATARFTSIDPVTHFEYSTYSAFDNNPVFWADPSGADAESLIDDAWNKSGSGETTWTNNNDGTFSGSNGGTAEDKDYNEEESQGESQEGVLNADGTCCANSGKSNSYETRNTVENMRKWKALSKEQQEEFKKQSNQILILIGTSAIPLGWVFKGGAWVFRAVVAGKVVTVAAQSSRFLIWGKNSVGHLIKHRDALGFGNVTAQQAQKMLPELRGAANYLLNAANPALTRVGAWHGVQNATMYISNGKMLVTKASGEFITVINKTANKWYNAAK